MEVEFDRAVDHRYEDGELEALVPGKFGGLDPRYEHLIWRLSWELNDSVSYLRGFLDNGSDEEVRMAFQVVERNYLMLRLEREHCRKNLTPVVFRTSSPLKWLLSLKSLAEELAGSPDLRTAFLAFSLAFLTSDLFWFWLFLLSRLPPGRYLRVLTASLLLIFLFGSLIFALNGLLKGRTSDNGPHPSRE
ncbi:hypothetical protein [Thermococcus sp.]|uniref:hypothetical protein n=1 Tax=Thermococcus sp. TaxID=35749 RepID=UPI0026374F58|nr:hypothetical protein [Thermococcus sp.]